MGLPTLCVAVAAEPAIHGTRQFPVGSYLVSGKSPDKGYPVIQPGKQHSEPPALEGAKDFRERYQELIAPSFWECPACHQGRMLVIEILPRRPHRKTATTDTS
jgi:hypothetical protein